MASLPLATRQVATVIAEEVWEDAGRLPCKLTIDLPLQHFCVHDLLRLERGAILQSRIDNSAQVPVSVNKCLLGWAEFEVVDDRVAVRMTELA